MCRTMDNDSENQDAEYEALSEHAKNNEGEETGAGVTWALLAIANRIDRLITVVSVKP
jgi:hypothetical protein